MHARALVGVVFAAVLGSACSSSDSSTPSPVDAESDTARADAADASDATDTSSPFDAPAKTPPGKTLCGAGDGSGPGSTFCDAATQDCCGETLKCAARGGCTGVAYQCSSAASCTGGMKCCFDPPTSGGPPVGKCQTTCTTMTLCETKDECAAGELCSPDPESNSCKK